MRIFGSWRARGVFAIGMIALASQAEATVTQVDGTILPVTSAMQTALDARESGIDAVKDAAETPQMFRPRLSPPVAFLDIAEGAGFENSFGWYNIGEIGRASCRERVSLNV